MFVITVQSGVIDAKSLEQAAVYHLEGLAVDIRLYETQGHHARVTTGRSWIPTVFC